MVVPPEGPLSYEARYRTSWVTYLLGFLIVAGGTVVTIAGGVRLYPVMISFTVFCLIVGGVAHLRQKGQLLLRVDGRGIELVESCLFVAWPGVLHADLGYSGDDRALVFRVVRGSVVPLSERGERAARDLNRPQGRSRWSAPYSELTMSSPELLDRAALTAVIRAHAPHVTGRFGTG